MEVRLIETLAACLDRLAGGELLEDCLRRYPSERPELAPMLQAWAILRDVPAAPPLDLTRVEQVALARAAELRVAPAPPNATRPASIAQRLPDWALPALIAALLIALTIAVITLFAQQSPITTTASATPTRVLSPTDTATASATFTLTATATPTASATPSATAVTATPSATMSPTVVIPPTASAPPPPPPTSTPVDDDDDDGGAPPPPPPTSPPVDDDDDDSGAPPPPPTSTGDDDDDDDDGGDDDGGDG